MNSHNNYEYYIARLSKLPRTGWKIRGVENPEMVSDHIWGTMLIAIIYNFTDDIKNNYYINDKVKIEQALSVMLLHDIQEIFTGDLTFRTKSYLNDTGITYKQTEEKCFFALADKFPESVKKKMKELWELYENPNDSISYNYHIIDMVEMLSQAYEYEKTGQGKLDEFWQWIYYCQSNTFLFALSEMIQRRSSFHRYMHRRGSYQHFQSTEHHASLGFANKLSELDMNKISQRDIIASNFVKSYINMQHESPLKVLDVGCGLGSFSRIFLEDSNNYEVLGIDVNPILLEEAKKKWANYNFSTLPPSDIGWYWNIPNDSKDIVLVGEVLEHVFDPEFILLEACRCLKENGAILISVPNSFNNEKLNRYNQDHIIEHNSKEEHIRYFGIENMLSYLEYAGFFVDELWGLSRGWNEKYNISDILKYDRNRLDLSYVKDKLSNQDSDRLYKSSWTLLFCAHKKDINTNKLLNDAINTRLKHTSTYEISQIHDFLEEMNKSKLLRFDNFDSGSLTISQLTFELCFFTFCFASEMNLDIEKALSFTIIQGLIESHIAEISPYIRIQFSSKIKLDILHDLCENLPKRISAQMISFYEELLRDCSPEALLPSLLLWRYYKKINIQYDVSDTYKKLCNKYPLFPSLYLNIFNEDIDSEV